MSQAGLVSDRCCDVFPAGDPRNVAVGFNDHVGDGDPHLGRQLEDSFPTFADMLPSDQSAPAGVDADGTGVGGPHLVHQLDVEALQGEVELEVGLNNLLEIWHRVPVGRVIS